MGEKRKTPASIEAGVWVFDLFASVFAITGSSSKHGLLRPLPVISKNGRSKPRPYMRQLTGCLFYRPIRKPSRAFCGSLPFAEITLSPTGSKPPFM